MDAEENILSISLRNTKWLYRGEGNANLVISLPEEKVILRFEKCNYTVMNSGDISNKRKQKLQRDVLFYKNVIVPFLGKAFIQPPLLGIINEEEVVSLDQELLTQRPNYRLSKGIRYEMVTLHPDYTHLPPVLGQIQLQSTISEQDNPTYCVEIKPKQGWVFPPDRRHPKCTYCLNQYLKVKKNRVLRISQYCPLDLFSGNKGRMKNAMKNLLFTPQNNLKIFQNGKLVYSDDSKENYGNILSGWLEPEQNGVILNSERLLDKWSELMTDALLRELCEEPSYRVISTTDNVESSNQQPENSPLFGIVEPCDWSTSTLPNNCVLNRIFSMQKLQDRQFALLYHSFCDQKKEEGDYDYVVKLLESTNAPGPIERYLLSTTAKDCSIFISFQHAQSRGGNGLHLIEDCDGKPFYMNIGISDIDPKPLSCIEKHFKRDQDVVETVLKYIEESK